MAAFNHQMLRQIRLDLDLSQEQAAASLGVDVRTFRRYEQGVVNRGRGFSVRHAARRRLLRRMCEELGVEREEDWLLPGKREGEGSHREALPDRTPPPLASGHRLPRARHFTGREALLARLLDWHRDRASPDRVVVLTGVGGAGKTALLERHLAALAASGDATRWLVHSFYEDPGIESLARAVMTGFAADPATVQPGTGQVESLLSLLATSGPVLLVLDGLEVAQSEGGEGRALGELEDPVLRRLLRAIAAGLGEARCLCSSRFPLTDLQAREGQGLLTLPVPDLSDDEACRLLQAWGVRGDVPTLRRSLAEVGHHALSLAMTGSYVGEFLGGDPAHVGAIPLDRAAADDPLARRLSAVLSAHAAQLSAEELDLLCRLAALPRGAELDLLHGLAGAGEALAGRLQGLDEAGLLRLLRRLQRRGLIQAVSIGPATRWTTHPFLRSHFRQRLTVSPAAVNEVARQRLAARLTGWPAGHPTSNGALDLGEALLEHTVLAGRLDEAAVIYLRGLGGFSHLGLSLGEMARGARLLRLFCERGAPDRSDARLASGLRGLLVYDLGLFTSALGDLGLADRAYRAHLEICASAGGPDAPACAMGWRTLGYNSWLRGDLVGARTLLERAVQVALSEPPQLIRSLGLLAAVLGDLGDEAAARDGFARARQVSGRPPESRRALWEAEHHLAGGDLEQASALAERSLAGSRGRGWANLEAHAGAVLGQLALATGAIDDAEPHLRRAREWARVSGEIEALLRASELAAALLLARGDAPGALAEAAGGLELATAHGFALFAVRLGVLAARARLAAGERDAARKEATRLHAEAASLRYRRGEALAAALEARPRRRR